MPWAVWRKTIPGSQNASRSMSGTLKGQQEGWGVLGNELREVEDRGWEWGTEVGGGHVRGHVGPSLQYTRGTLP